MTLGRIVGGLVVVSLAAALPAVAQDDPAATSPWSGNLGLAYVATSGNSKTQTFGVDFKLERVADPWGLEVIGLFNRSKEDAATTAERYLAGVRGKRAFGERWEMFVGLSGEQDEFAGYELLAVAEVGMTYKMLQGPRHLLSFDAGLTYTDEDRIDPEPDVDYAGGVAGLAYEWKISDHAALTERLLWYPNFDATSNWRLTSETGVTASLTSALALRLGYELRYRNEPIADKASTDSTTKASLVVSF